MNRKLYEGSSRSESSSSGCKELISIMDLLGSNNKEFLKRVEKFTENLEVTTNQLRNLYDIIVDMDCENKDDVNQRLLKLRILLEYSHRRELLGKKNNSFYICMKELIEDMLDEQKRDQKKVEKFLQLFEAIIAYTKK